MRYQRYRLVLVMVLVTALALVALPVTPAYAAACTFTSNVAATGNWSVAGSWTAVGTSCGTYPGSSFAGDTVVISAGDTITLDVSPANPIASLTLNSGTAGTVSRVTFSGANSLTVTGAVTINGQSGATAGSANYVNVGAGTLSAGSLALTATTSGSRFSQLLISTGTTTILGNITSAGTASQIVFSGAGTLNAGGTFMSGAQGTFTAGTGTVNYNGTGTQTVGAYTYNNLTISNTSATVSATANFNVAGTMTVNANATFSPGAAVQINSAAAAGTITGAGMILVTRVDASNALDGQYNFTTKTLTNLTVDFAAAGNQGVDALTYSNLIFSGSGAKSVSTGTSVAGNLSVAPSGSATASIGNSLNIPVGSLTLGGLGRINGTWGSTNASNPATYKNSIYFGTTTTGILNVSTDTRATPTVTTWPTASGITYGQALSASALSGGTASVAGSFAFTAPGTVPPAGNYSASVTFTPSDLTSYTTVVNNVNVVVTPKALTVSGITADNKVYDGNTTATLNTGSAALVGVVGSDDVTLDSSGAAGTFDTANVDTGKTVTVSGLTLGGADAGNYSLTQPTTTADITAKNLTVSGLTADNKVYDGNTTATLNTGSAALVGVVGSDDVTLDTTGAAGTFDTANVGTNKTVTVSGLTLTGADAGNYSLTQPTTTADITAKALTVSGITADNKVYDGNTTATLNTGSAVLVGVVGSDDVTLDVSGAVGTFDTAAVGTGKTVTVSGLTLSGADAGNYSLTQPTTTADITPKNLTVTGITADNKVYDGNTTATLNSGSAVLVGVVGSDDVTLDVSGAVGTFDTANVGTGKTVTVSGLALSGADTGNYSLTQPTTTANITAKNLTVSGLTADNKVYDGNMTATLNTGSAALVGVVGSDDVTLDSSGAVGTFDTANVGTGKTVTVSGLTLSGADAGNYSLTQPTTTADITTRPITVTAVTDTKEYDGTTSSAGVPTITSGSLAAGDTATWTQTFDTKNVGTGKTLTPTGSVSDGNGGNNYAVTFVTDTTGVITAKALTVSGITADNKVYDGNTTATLNTGSAALVGVVGSDDVTLDTSGAVGTFDTANVGTGKTVTASGLTLSGADAGNYSLTQPTTTADITAKALTVTGITANDKPYDGNTTATLNTGSAALVGVVGSDDVTLDSSGAVGTFASANVGTWTVTISGLAITGADISNYTLIQPTTTASITGATVTVTGITADNKVYDGTTAATLDTTGATLVGVVSGDDVTLEVSGAVGTFDTANVGTGKIVTVSGLTLSGADAGKYSLTQPTTTADITPKPVTVTANAGQSKVFGAADPVLTYTSSDPAATFSGALSRVAGENVGTYAITQSTLVGTGNYTIGSFVPADFTITPASTTTSLVSSANPSVFGSSVTFTATVAPSSATGTVQFYADGATLGSAQSLSGSGTASVSTSSLAVGTHVITATYSGDTNHLGSTGTLSPNQVVSPACDPVTGVNFSFAPSVPRVGQSVLFTATVTAGTAPITYTWNFGHGGNVEATSAVTAHSFPLTTTVQTYNVTLSAANACTSPTTPVAKPVTVWPYLVYLPIIMR
jgi:hypothetical protein